MARARQTTKPSSAPTTSTDNAAAEAPKVNPKSAKAQVEQAESSSQITITDEPLAKKPAARRQAASKDSPKIYKVSEGSIMCRKGPDYVKYPIASEIYNMTFPATGPVGAARKAFAKIYKGISPSKKGTSQSEKPDEIVYNLIVTDVATGKQFPYLATRRRRETPNIITKGSGVVQWNADGTTRVKNWTSAQAAADSLGGEACSSVEDLQKAHPGFKWTGAMFEQHFDTKVKAFKNAQPSLEEPQSSASSSTQEQEPIVAEHEVTTSEPKVVIAKKRIPQAPKKPVQVANVPEPVLEVSEATPPPKAAPKGRAKAAPKTEVAVKAEETVKPPAKGRAKAK
jgi:hypothetical protein